MEGLAFEVVLPGSDELRALRGPDLDRALWKLEQLSRTIEAARAEVIASADQTMWFTNDGHRSVRNWSMAVTNSSPGEAKRRDQTARLVKMWPELGDELRAATIGVAQVHELARLAANPRCGDRLPESGAVLVQAAKDLPYLDFRVACARWEQLADADGAHRSHEASLERRDVRITEVAGEFQINGRLPAIHGTILREILGKFTEAEFHADWDTAKALHGDAMSVDKRTAPPPNAAPTPC